jgi:hypothetical protein
MFRQYSTMFQNVNGFVLSLIFEEMLLACSQFLVGAIRLKGREGLSALR